MGPPGPASLRNLPLGGEGGEAGRRVRAPFCSLQSLWVPQALDILQERNNNTTTGLEEAKAKIRSLRREQAASAAAMTHLQAENTCLQSDKKELTERWIDARAENMLLRGHKRQLQVELQEARNEIKRLRNQEMDRYAQ